MIRARCQDILLKQARLLVAIPLSPMGSSSPSTRSIFDEENFSDLITLKGIYVNKIPKLVPLI